MIGSKKSENSLIKPIIVTGLVFRVRSTIYYEKSESWWFGGDEIVGKFKRRSCTKLEFAKDRPKTGFFFNIVFFFLNVKCPRFLVQMSEWCYRSQCSWFCFLLVIYGRCLTRVLVFLYTRPNRSMTVFVCFALSFIVLAVSCILDCYRILYHFIIIIWVIPNKAVKKNKRKKPTHTFTSPFGATK